MANLYISALVSMGALGAFFATGLAAASKMFAIEADPRIAEIGAALPGANCGGCGYAGCANYAEAVVEGAAPNLCPVGGDKVSKKIAEIMGVSVDLSEKKVAQVLCQGGISDAVQRSEYRGIPSCRAAKAIGGGHKGCTYGCLGFGDCMNVCPFGAISMSVENIPLIDPEICTGCGKCVETCPKAVIVLAGASRLNHIRCRATISGKETKELCKTGCIACGACAKVCPTKAIEVKNGLAILHYDKCINCGMCAEKCPVGTIDFGGERIEEIEINDHCVGCTLCAKVCPVAAISGEVKKKHQIDASKCIKCGQCAERCKKNAFDVRYKKK